MKKEDSTFVNHAVEIGKRVKRYRGYSHMTQKELADQATVSQSSITRLETGETMPSVFTMINIAKVLHAPISKLLLGNQCEPDDQISGIVMKMKEIISRDLKQGQALIEGLEKLLDAVMMEYED